MLACLYTWMAIALVGNPGTLTEGELWQHRTLQYTDGGRTRRLTLVDPRLGQLELWEAETGRRIEAWHADGVILRVTSREALEAFVQALAHAHPTITPTPLMATAGLFLLPGEPFHWLNVYDGVRQNAGLETEVELTPNFSLAVHAHSVPNDPLFAGQWYLETIDIVQAWSITEGSAATEILVVDNGCDLNHPDLADKILPGIDVVDDDEDPSFVPAPSCSSDQDCCPGGGNLGACCNERALCNTGNNHGTACAGIIAATSNNATGIAGVCPSCSLRCARFLSDEPVPLSATIRVFDFALQQGVAVVSNSWGYLHAVAAPTSLAAAIDRVIHEGRGGLGAVVVFAAGNDARALQSDEITALPGVLTVGATTVFDELTSFSNFGESIDIVAPGGTLTTDISGPDGGDAGDYTSQFGGTSASCPTVAGVAALVASHHEDWSGLEIAQRLIDTARPAPYAQPDENGHDAYYGYGLVNPYKALAPDEVNLDPSGSGSQKTSGGCHAWSAPGWATLAALWLVLIRKKRVAGKQRAVRC